MLLHIVSFEAKAPPEAPRLEVKTFESGSTDGVGDTGRAEGDLKEGSGSSFAWVTRVCLKIAGP